MLTDNNNISPRVSIWLTFFFGCGFMVLINIGKPDFSLEWTKDYNIWLNEYISTFFIYLVSFAIFKKIRRPFIKESLSIVLALLVSNSITYNYNNLNISSTGQLVLKIMLPIFLVFFSLLFGVSIGTDSAKKSIIEHNEKKEYAIKNISPEIKTKIYNCNRLIKKYRKEIEFIETYGTCFISDFVATDKEMKKNERRSKKEN